MEVPDYVCPYCSAEVGTHDDLKSHISTEHQAEEAVSPAREPEEEFIKGTATLSWGRGGGAARVEAKRGRIVRIRPLHYDEKYTPEEIGQWQVKAHGKVFQSRLKTLPNPHSFAYKKRTYSPNRIKYPLKRVDWDPNGERNPQNRGRSKYKRISWDEATDIIASEIKRVKKKYGPYAIFLQADGHGETKIVHAPHGCHTRMFECMSEDKIRGEYTVQVRTPDSLEGWLWGAHHMWGLGTAFTGGPNVFKDVAEHTDILFFWGSDWETTPWQWGGQDFSLWAFFHRDIGIKRIFVSPGLNYAAAVHADKWIPVYPHTDSALYLAIAYTWLEEGTYDKEYIATHTHGFDKFRAYVTGEEDGIPKTPRWASPLCGVPVWTIKALAREWASKTAAFSAGTCGPLCRGPYATEPIRLHIACRAMQGLGKPGTYTIGLMNFPRGKVQANPYGAYHGRTEAAQTSLRWLPKQFIPKTRLCDAILDHSSKNPMKFYSTGSIVSTKVEDQFVEYQYPVEGYPEIHMIWSDTPCWQTCWNQGFRIDEAFRSPKIETVIMQHPWLENDCLYADIILPVCTKLELQDIMIGSDQFSWNVCLEGKCCEPVGESKSDYEAVCEVDQETGRIRGI